MIIDYDIQSAMCGDFALKVALHNVLS